MHCVLHSCLGDFKDVGSLEIILTRLCICIVGDLHNPWTRRTIRQVQLLLSSIPDNNSVKQ